jgi:hypothetical protein
MSSAYVFTKPEQQTPLPRLPMTVRLGGNSSNTAGLAVVIARAEDADLQQSVAPLFLDLIST